MRFANLIQKILDFINLGKVAVDAAPGVLLALALGLITVSIIKVPVLPFARGEPDMICGDQGEHNRFEARLCGVWGLVRKQERQVEEALAAEADVDRKVGVLEAEKQRVETDLQKLRETRQTRLVGDVIGSSLNNEIGQLETHRDEIVGGLQGLAPQKAQEEKRAALAQAKLDELNLRLSEVQKGGIGGLGDLFEFLLDHLIALSLLGWALGIVLNPLNRAFLKWGDTESVTTQQAQLEVEALITRLQAAGVTLPDEQDLKKFVTDQEIGYFLGRKFVSREEWDDLVSSYYRWAELSINLVVPLSVLGLALIVVGLFSNDSIKLVLLLAGAVLLFMMAAVAYRRGRTLYREYKKRQSAFFVGRLEKVLLDARQARLAQSLEAVATKLVDVFNDLLKRAGGAKSSP